MYEAIISLTLFRGCKPSTLDNQDIKKFKFHQQKLLSFSINSDYVSNFVFPSNSIEATIMKHRLKTTIPAPVKPTMAKDSSCFTFRYKDQIKQSMKKNQTAKLIGTSNESSTLALNYFNWLTFLRARTSQPLNAKKEHILHTGVKLIGLLNIFPSETDVETYSTSIKTRHNQIRSAPAIRCHPCEQMCHACIRLACH